MAKIKGTSWIWPVALLAGYLVFSGHGREVEDKVRSQLASPLETKVEQTEIDPFDQYATRVATEPHVCDIIEKPLRIKDPELGIGIGWDYLYFISGGEQFGIDELHFKATVRDITRQWRPSTKAFYDGGLNAFPETAVGSDGSYLYKIKDYTILVPMYCDGE